jgi:ribose 5-phosphate isomerase B
MKIFIGADHAGVELKQELAQFLSDQGHTVIDKGAYIVNNDDDYPDYIIPVANEIALHRDSKGIIIGGSGQGEAIAANRVKGVRAALYYGGNTDILKLSREHNNANILSLGARFLTVDEAKEAVRLWLTTEFSDDERHKRRIDKIEVN